MTQLYLIFLLIIPIVTIAHQDVLFIHEDVVDHNHVDNLLGNIQNYYQDTQYEHQHDHNIYDHLNTHTQMGSNALQVVKLHNQLENINNNHDNKHGTGEHYSTNPDINTIQNKKWQTEKVNFIFGPNLPQPPPLTTHEPMITTGATSSEHHDTTIPSHSLETTIHTDLHTTDKTNHQEETTSPRGNKYSTNKSENKPDSEHTFTTETVTRPTTHHTEAPTTPKTHNTEVTTRPTTHGVETTTKPTTHSSETTKPTTHITETTTNPTTHTTETTTKPTTHTTQTTTKPTTHTTETTTKPTTHTTETTTKPT
ncbi:uncharacterized protein CMU_037520, partial [Cryptosporidium muris RN66]